MAVAIGEMKNHKHWRRASGLLRGDGGSCSRQAAHVRSWNWLSVVQLRFGFGAVSARLGRSAFKAALQQGHFIRIFEPCSATVGFERDSRAGGISSRGHQYF